MSEAANAAQAERWNGESGRHWVAHRERHHAGHQRLIPHLFRAASISAGDRVLDVGCGCGETTIAAARLAGGVPAGHAVADGAGPGGRGSRGSALGLDLSGPMLAAARRLAAEAAVANIGFEQGDAQVYPLPRDLYDVVISSFGVMFFGDPVAAFANIVSAVRPGGRLAFLCWQDDSRNELFGIPLRAVMASAPLAVQADDDPFTDPRRVADLLSAAGWANIGIEAVSELAWMGTNVADVMDYVRGMRRIRALIAELDDKARAEAALNAMSREYAARQRADGIWVGAAAWLVSADRG
jgi:SAM-dependent methyltransferase